MVGAIRVQSMFGDYPGYEAVYCVCSPARSARVMCSISVSEYGFDHHHRICFRWIWLSEFLKHIIFSIKLWGWGSENALLQMPKVTVVFVSFRSSIELSNPCGFETYRKRMKMNTQLYIGTYTLVTI